MSALQEVNERILSAWLMMIMAVDSERVASQLPYNEAVVCNLLYGNNEKQMTATDLCTLTKMQKSLMNRTLTSLESKNLVERVRSNEDKRQILVRLVNDENNIYYQQHQKTLRYVDQILEKLGVDQADEIVELFTSIADIARNK